jgi:predicted nucleic acid-binding protein
MGQPVTILIDTDVILDLLLDRKKFSDDAAMLITLCEQSKVKAYVTPIIFANVYYFIQKTAGAHQAILKSLALLKILDVIPVSKANIIDALVSPMADKEDAMQSAGAVANGTIHAIVTRNVNDYKKSPLIAITPADFLSME